MKLKHITTLCMLIITPYLLYTEEILYQNKVLVDQIRVEGSEIKDTQGKLNYVPRELEATDSGREEPEPVPDDDPQGKEGQQTVVEELKSLEHYFNTKFILEQRGYEWTLYYATTLRKIGLSFYYQKNYPMALNYYQKSQQVFRRIKQYESLYHKNLYYNIHQLYKIGIKDSCKSLYWLQKANIIEQDEQKKQFNAKTLQQLQAECHGKEGA